MNRRVYIPVRVQQPVEPSPPASLSHVGSPGNRHKEASEPQPAKTPRVEEAQPSPAVEAAPEMLGRKLDSQGQLEEWRDRALRLQAEMDNYRKRQQRLAQDQIEAERHRLVRAFLRVVDDLERALQVAAGGEDLRRGVELTHHAALQLLKNEGVERIQAQDEPFDPNWHEAVATTAGNNPTTGPNTVAQVMEPGYRMGDKLLRPSKVVVAV